MRARVANGCRREAAFQDQGDEVGGVCHRDGAVARQCGEGVGFAFAVVAVASGAAVAVEAFAGFVDGPSWHCIPGGFCGAGGKRFEVFAHCRKISVAGVLRALKHDLGHRAQGGAAFGGAVLEPLCDLFDGPVGDRGFALVGERGSVPIVPRHHRAVVDVACDRRAQRVASAVAGTTMREALHEVRAAIPLR